MVRKKWEDLKKFEQATVCSGNIWEVSFLIYNKISFLRSENHNGKIVFIFSDNPEVQKILQDFIMNPAVQLQEYIGIFQRLKNLIYQQKGRGHEKRKTEVKG